MKLINWALENSYKNIVIITNTNEQVDYVLKEIKLNLFHDSIHSFAPAGRGELRFDNNTLILIAPKRSLESRFRGITIDVLLFCDMGTNTINAIKRSLFPQMMPETRIIGVLKI